jgi:hypothetical protein
MKYTIFYLLLPDVPAWTGQEHPSSSRPEPMRAQPRHHFPTQTYHCHHYRWPSPVTWVKHASVNIESNHQWSNYRERKQHRVRTCAIRPQYTAIKISSTKLAWQDSILELLEHIKKDEEYKLLYIAQTPLHHCHNNILAIQKTIIGTIRNSSNSHLRGWWGGISNTNMAMKCFGRKVIRLVNLKGVQINQVCPLSPEIRLTKHAVLQYGYDVCIIWINTSNLPSKWTSQKHELKCQRSKNVFTI